MNNIDEYIKTGISIEGNPEKGYDVFTVETQRFHINALADLTPDRFELEIENWRIIDKLTSEMFENF